MYQNYNVKFVCLLLDSAFVYSDIVKYTTIRNVNEQNLLIKIYFFGIHKLEFQE